MLLPVAVAPREIEPVAATELDDLLDDTTATELEDLLDEATDGAELDLGTDERAELAAGTDEGATDELVLPQADAVNCALFLPTPA